MKGPLTLYTPSNHIKLNKCLKENSPWFERTFLGSNNSVLTESKNSSSSGIWDTGAFPLETFLTVGKTGCWGLVLQTLGTLSLWKNTAALNLFSNFSQSSNNLTRLMSRGTGQKDGPLLSNNFWSSETRSSDDKLMGWNCWLHTLKSCLCCSKVLKKRLFFSFSDLFGESSTGRFNLRLSFSRSLPCAVESSSWPFFCISGLNPCWESWQCS